MGIFHCHVSLLEGKLQQDFGVTIVGIPSFYHLLPSRKRENKLTPPNEKFGKSSTQKCLGMGYVSTNEGNDLNEITTRNVDASECSFFSSSVKGSSPKKKTVADFCEVFNLVEKACTYRLSTRQFHVLSFPTTSRTPNIYTPKTNSTAGENGWLEDEKLFLGETSIFERQKLVIFIMSCHLGRRSMARKWRCFFFVPELAAFFVATAASRPGPIRAVDHLHHLQ